MLYVVLPEGTCNASDLGMSMTPRDFMVNYLSAQYPLLEVRTGARVTLDRNDALIGADFQFQPELKADSET